jgi:hypothetical protein
LCFAHSFAFLFSSSSGSSSDRKFSQQNQSIHPRMSMKTKKTKKAMKIKEQKRLVCAKLVRKETPK